MSDPAFEALWHKLLEQWADPAQHERFLNHCLETQQLPQAAARYRATANLDTQPYLQRITQLALHQIDSSRTPRSVALRNAGSLVATLLMLSLSVAMLLTAFR